MGRHGDARAALVAREVGGAHRVRGDNLSREIGRTSRLHFRDNLST